MGCWQLHIHRRLRPAIFYAQPLQADLPPLRCLSFPHSPDQTSLCPFAAPALAQGSTAPSHLVQQREPGQRARVFQGGYFVDLHKMLDISSGSQVGHRATHAVGRGRRRGTETPLVASRGTLAG